MAASQRTILAQYALSLSGLEANADSATADTNNHGADDERDVDSIYYAAVNGEIGVLKDNPERIDRFETPDKNSVLHVFITAKPHQSKWLQGIKFLQVNIARQTTEHSRVDKAKFVEEILGMRPALLLKTNDKKEIPLHIAARHGHSDVVETLLEWCRKEHENDLEKGNGAVRDMLGMKNKANDTALHEAVRYNHIDVVKALTKENYNISYEANLEGESPLYLAVERGYVAVIDALLKVSPSSSWDHGGPNGRTVLHAAVLHNNTVLTEKLLKEVAQKSDEKGWIPLHYAAYFGNVAIVKQLLKADKSSACIPTTTEKMTAIHLAASRGNLSVMRELISSCPRCCELVDRRGWNVVHFAVVSENKQVVDYVLRCPLLRNLINERNTEGNAPLHLLIDSGFYMRSFIRDPRVDRLAFNAKNLNCLDIILSKEGGSHQLKAACYLSDCGARQGKRVIIEPNDWKEKNIKPNDWKEDGSSVTPDDNRHLNEDDSSKVVSKGYSRREYKGNDNIMKQIKDARASELVVAALITTVSFAAGFTVPGGYKSDGPDEGAAVLLGRSTAFHLFVLTNTMSMTLSSSAVLFHFFMAIRGDKKLFYPILIPAKLLTSLAMTTMVIAFISGTYAVLAHVQLVAISNCVLAGSFFGFLCYLGYYFDKVEWRIRKIRKP
ncbi:hypothetical protein K2173_024282 [Erythroxylum novogranatense]|uniref:PGG domain-containing protein n=1 Tax=Erythroxylum novogranatense TaxID=1862640 RepID=A0AAV8SUL2_9ROSI|nr:hypothetical protein K2173_024282 [Erythroxylum novogranatense]